MKFIGSTLVAFTIAALSSLPSQSEAFTVGLATTKPTTSSFVPQSLSKRNTNTNNLNQSTSSNLMMSYSVGIVGATGAVGKEIRQCLEKSSFPTDKLRIFGSERSKGKVVESDKFGSITVELFDVEKARECNVVFLAVSGDFALEHAKAISDNDGAVVIDNSSAFRYEKDIPLVVPEINGQCTKGARLIANPNCTTAIGLMALWPLHKAFQLKKILMSTYQAASGAGQPGMDELTEGTKTYLNDTDEQPKNEIFAYPLPFNVIPQIDKFQDNGYTKEEMKVTWESRKICGLDDEFPISCTAVRIPTIRAHSEVIVVETEKDVDMDVARQVLEDAPGVKVLDNQEKLEYPMPLTATGSYDVEVGRLRESLVFGKKGIEFFVCGDQLLRGAALNAVLVAEEMNTNGALAEMFN
eukprot:CAMPEP_0194131652 /NCGR_PEP_ID=MMETSP0152-20130528/2377_1 /TAXON_ID=1049557 /ORGANISM="Thalassiothrix antarctica, Strain L6-D1" /LENGTH=410 /DNA_ID=CAMNT_0038826503 /DNA_START=61 /DNA_END=1293 /DNA_ORIENTATION=+